MVVRVYILFLFVLFAKSSISQNNPVLDSLKIELSKATHDSVRCRILTSMVDNDYDDNSWPKHNKNMLKIVLKHVNENTIPKNKEDSVFFSALLSAYNIEGYVMMEVGDYKKALEYFNKVIKLHNRIGLEAILASVYNNIAGIHAGNDDQKMATQYFKKTLEISTKLNDRYHMAKAYGNLAQSYRNANDIKTALDYSYKALDLYKETNDKTGQSLVYNNLGRMYRELGDKEKELENYLKAYAINNETGNKRGLSYNSGNISLYYFDLNKFDLSYKYALEGYNLASELGLPELLSKQALWMYKLEKQRNNWKNALDYYLIYDKMLDSLKSEENTKAAIEQQMQFEYDKKKAIDQTAHEKELEIAGEKEKKQRVISMSIAFGLLLVIIFSLIIFQRLRLTNKQKQIIENQKLEVDAKNEIIEEKQKEIIDSINYARRIQYALLAHDKFLNENLNDYFVYFNPKDIVSGDFYWATSVNSAAENCFYLAVCDCTGHGVPGAFMSLLSIGFLSEAIKEKYIREPGEIFNYVRERLIENISKEEQKDGFDGILICINSTTNKITYAAANNEPVLVDSKTFTYLPTDKMPVGIGISNESFKTYELNYKSGDLLYIYTDGYADQFGGPKGKKFKYKQLNELLLENHSMSLNEQELLLKKSFESWKGNLEQVDDVCVIGIKL